MSSKMNSVFLEVDTSIRDKNLLITKSVNEEDELNKFLHSTGIGQLPSITVKPTPGFCVKARETNGTKIFINFCQTDKIPAPKDITEAELAALLDSDEICDFRVPMSIGSVRTDNDNKGEEVNVCDIAINIAFMTKCNELQTFKQFLIAVAFEGYQTKFDVTVGSERIVLKNKKVMGTLQVHHIQQREVEKKMGLPETLPKLDEIMTDARNSPIITEARTNMIQVLDEVTNTPKYRLFKKRNDAGVLYGEFYLPYVTSAKDISLDIGEDRLILETTNGKYFLDTFHEFCVDQQQTCSEYNKASKFLTVTMPIVTKS